MAVEYVCEYCGYQGRDDSEDHVDRVQCAACGELVIPLGRTQSEVRHFDGTLTEHELTASPAIDQPRVWSPGTATDP